MAALPASKPVAAIAVHPKDHKDEVKLATALHRLAEEDLGLVVEHRLETAELLLRGQGEVHLKVAMERLARGGVGLIAAEPRIAYRESISKGASQRSRHKKQSGGHGQFGDVHIEIAPQERGAGFAFIDKITGGVVPRQYIGSVEAGAIEALKKGPLGFAVVDVAVTLLDGSYHSVDSSDQAFQMAGAMAVREALPQCQPVLLEPVLAVDIEVPNDATARVTGIITGRRGHILGFEAMESMDRWDVVRCHIPESEMRNLIVELRSVTSGVGTFTARFDHLAELSGKLADRVVEVAKTHAA
jgi:elongation factor G